MSLDDPSGPPLGLVHRLEVALEPTLDSASAKPQTAAAVQVTQRLGRFVLLRQLGTGGMGSVFAAYDEQLDRKVALKLLHQSTTAQGDQRLRVLREAQAMARVAHHNVVHVYDVGEVGGRIFIAMEFIDGSTLTSWQESQPRSCQETLHLYRQAGEGLLAAHQNGLVHRDFKPDNVLVDRDCRVRVADFGLARRHDQTVASASATAGSSSRPGIVGTPLTVAGSICGTPGYMSPEQYRGEIVDSRSDQFSFCVSLYEALFRHLPFAGDAMAEQAANVLAGRVLSPPDDRLVPPAVRGALMRGLSLDPEERFPTMAELPKALTADAEPDPAAARSTRRRLSALILAAATLISATALAKYTRGALATRTMVDIAAFGLLTTVCFAVALRRSLRLHAFHRGLVSLMLIAHSTWLGVRALGLALHLELAQLIPIDLMVIGGLYATIAYQYLPGLWWWAGGAVAGAIISAIRPQNAEQIGQVVYAPIAFIIMFAWEREATKRRMRKPTES